MRTLQYQITVEDSRVQELYAFLTSLRFVHEVLPLPAPKTEPPTPSKEKLAYTVEDIRAIARRFPKNKKWKAQDLEVHFPQNLPIKVQIIKNRLYIMPTPRENHQFIVAELVMTMGIHAKTHKLGQIYPSPLDVVFNENNVLQPDVLFLKLSRRQGATDDSGRIVIAPDLVVEIWSPSNRKKEREEKREVYETSGVAEYWSISPQKQHITVEILNEAGKYEIYSEAKKAGKLKSKILEGFEIDIADLILPEMQTKTPKKKKKK